MPLDTQRNPGSNGDLARNHTLTLQQKLLLSNNQVSRENNLPSSVCKLRKLLKAQNYIMNELLSEVDNLTALKGLTRSDRIKDSIDKLIELSERLNSNRFPLHGALGMVIKAEPRRSAAHLRYHKTTRSLHRPQAL